MRRDLAGARIGLLVNQGAVTADLHHAVDALVDTGLQIVRLFGPEHGVRGHAQDMEAVGESRDPISGLPVCSLYGDSLATLAPPPETLSDLDVVLVDLPDVGSRYYTFAATAVYLASEAQRLGAGGPSVWILDRPNPINGLAVEGNLVGVGFESFVSAISVPNRHGLTLAELVRYAGRFGPAPAFETECITCHGWSRGMWHDETGLPWVMPSPNMPTLDTAAIYPGMCLLEATNLSEGRGTTRPFELFGAPFIDAHLLARELGRLGLSGVAFRPVVFKPGFQKWANEACHGVQVHITDRDAMRPYELGISLLWMVRRLFAEGFEWRAQPYEFVHDVPAIDLLCGTDRVRHALERGADLDTVLASACEGGGDFEARAEQIRLYGS